MSDDQNKLADDVKDYIPKLSDRQAMRLLHRLRPDRFPDPAEVVDGDGPPRPARRSRPADRPGSGGGAGE